MSIERLEEIKREYLKYCPAGRWEASISNFLQECIDTFKDQSDQIADLQNQIEQGKE